MPLAMIYLMRGKAGTGKTTLSSELGKKLKLPVLHKDDLYDAVATEMTEHDARNRICFDFLYRTLEGVLAADASIILDYGYNHEDDLRTFMQWVEERGGKLRHIHCICSDEAIWAERLAERSHAPLANQRITDLDKLKEHYKHMKEAFIEGEIIADSIHPLECLVTQLNWQTNPSELRIVSIKSLDRSVLMAFFTTQWGSLQVVSSTGIFQCYELEGFAAVNENGVIRGLITYQIDANVCEIVTINSLEENRGIGTSLISQVERAARDNGCHRLKLVTTNDNVHAFAFYQKRGFRLVELLPNAVEKARAIKPEIPLIADNGIAIRDELVLDKMVISESE